MATLSKNPIYNLSAVLRETGLKADLVRAWERRYNLPNPQRSAGGHRLYSQYDIETLKWLKEKQAQGLSISNAVELWRTEEQLGRDPLARGEDGGQVEKEIESANDEVLPKLRQRWIDACLNFGNAAAEDALTQAFAVHPVEMVVSEVLQSGLREIGQGWLSGRYSVQQEHFASALAERRLLTLLTLTPPPTRPQTVLLGCPSDEMHSLPVTVLHLFLRRRGFNVVYLGANIPLDQLVATSVELAPGLIILAAQTIRTAANLLEVCNVLQSTGIPLAYGGLIFNRVPALRESIPAHFLGEDLHAAAEKAESLLLHSKAEVVKASTINPYHSLASRFLGKRAAVEFSAQEHLAALGLPIEHITAANHFFSTSLLAALKLGDPAYLETDLDWVRLLLDGRNIQGTYLKEYLKTYGAFMGEYLGSEAAAVSGWLNRYAEKLT
jgi:DNA-binding transcriptional MerR regulator/methylmalonyl-CoA mutase cobalamin-binding subunit